MTQRMSLKDAAGITPARNQGPKCSVGSAIEEMDAEDRAQLDDWLAMPLKDMAHSRLTRILRTAGFKVGADAVARHRNGGCACRND